MRSLAEIEYVSETKITKKKSSIVNLQLHRKDKQRIQGFDKSRPG